MAHFELWAVAAQGDTELSVNAYFLRLWEARPQLGGSEAHMRVSLQPGQVICRQSQLSWALFLASSETQHQALLGG